MNKCNVCNAQRVLLIRMNSIRDACNIRDCHSRHCHVVISIDIPFDLNMAFHFNVPVDSCVVSRKQQNERRRWWNGCIDVLTMPNWQSNRWTKKPRKFKRATETIYAFASSASSSPPFISSSLRKKNNVHGKYRQFADLLWVCVIMNKNNETKERLVALSALLHSPKVIKNSMIVIVCPCSLSSAGG